MPERKEFPENPSLELQQTLLLHPEANPTAYVPFENATAHAFDAGARTWSRANAWWLADASWLAYSRDPAFVAGVFARHAGLSSFTSITGDGTECYLAHDDQLAIVAFRGTQPDDWADFFNNIRFVPRPWDVGFVHQGFAAALEPVWSRLAQAVGRLPATCRLWLTGHSLGAALAVLAGVRFGARATGVYTFGSPRVGDATLAGHIGRQFQERSIRYVNDHDVVTHVPPPVFAFPGRYTHVDHLRWIDPDGHVGPGRPAVEHFFQEVFGNSRMFLDIIEAGERGVSISLPDALADHTPLYYALHAWNDFAVHG